jgi:octanoyl-[GcvH]:protein N-octanoyltransferase
MKLDNVLAPYGQLKLIEGPNFLEPKSDISIAPRLLKYSSDKYTGSLARIYRPQRTVAFTSRDLSTPGYRDAVQQAENLGFAAVKRSPGGRAVAYHEESVVFDLLSHDPNPHKWINERFQAMGEVFIETFARLGIHSHLGELPREYCPGKYSVITDTVKLVGTAQRITPGGWLIGASVVVRNIAPVREVLDYVYRALNMEMDPATVASLNEFDSGISVEDLITALHFTLKNHFEISDLNLTINLEQETQELENA